MSTREIVGERRSHHTTSPDRVGARDAVAVLWDALPARCPQCGGRSTWPNEDGVPMCVACATTFHVLPRVTVRLSDDTMGVEVNE